MQMLTRDGVSLGFVEQGVGEPPLLLIHGWCCDHTYLQPQFDAFARTHQVVAVDLRGHGASDAPQQDYTMTGFADDVAWMLDQLGLPPCVLVGHSMGGVIVFELAARYPNYVSAVVSIDAPLVMPGDWIPENDAVVAGLGSAAYREVAHTFVDGMFLPTDDPERRSQILASIATAPQYVMVSALAHLYSCDTASLMERCDVPALAIYAADYPTARLRELCPQLMIGQTVGAGHFTQLEAPDQVNAMIERFLQVALNRQV